MTAPSWPLRIMCMTSMPAIRIRAREWIQVGGVHRQLPVSGLWGTEVREPRPNSDRRPRGHAHDPQRPARRNQRPSLVCSEPVLLAGFLISVGLAAMLGLFALLRQNPDCCPAKNLRRRWPGGSVCCWERKFQTGRALSACASVVLTRGSAAGPTRTRREGAKASVESTY